MSKHLLLATDGSPAAHHAEEVAIALAAALGARMHALHVLAPQPAVALAADVIEGGSHARHAIRHIHGDLADVREKARRAGVPCHVEHVFDHRPYAAIAGAAMKHRCDLIVMGAHARDAPLATDVTHQVILHCDVPVLVCR